VVLDGEAVKAELARGAEGGALAKVLHQAQPLRGVQGPRLIPASILKK